MCGLVLGVCRYGRRLFVDLWVVFVLVFGCFGFGGFRLLVGVRLVGSYVFRVMLFDFCLVCWWNCIMLVFSWMLVVGRDVITLGFRSVAVFVYGSWYMLVYFGCVVGGWLCVGFVVLDILWWYVCFDGLVWCVIVCGIYVGVLFSFCILSGVGWYWMGLGWCVLICVWLDDYGFVYSWYYVIFLVMYVGVWFCVWYWCFVWYGMR